MSEKQNEETGQSREERAHAYGVAPESLAPVTASLAAENRASKAMPVCVSCEANARWNESAGYPSAAAKCRAYCRNGHKMPEEMSLTIQFYQDELDYVYAQLDGREEGDGSFVGTFCQACLCADAFNYPLLRPVLSALMKKYPADPERLRVVRAAGEKNLMERIAAYNRRYYRENRARWCAFCDSGREPEPFSNRDDVQDAAGGER